MMPTCGSTAASKCAAVHLFFCGEEGAVLGASTVSCAADAGVEGAGGCAGCAGDGNARSDVLFWDVVASPSKSDFDE
jgi:hypothetical protein